MQVIGMQIGASFSEVCKSEKLDMVLPSSRFYLPRTPVRQILSKILPPSSLDQILVSSRYFERLFEFRLGGSTAQVVTEGFQNWPSLSATTSRSQKSGKRPPPLSSNELCFGMSERIDSQGQVVTPLRHEDIAKLAEDLKKSNVKKVVLLLLNSSKNPTHQDQLSSVLSEQGFQVFKPMQNTQINEAARWRKALLEASLQGTFEELNGEIEEGLQSASLKTEILFSEGPGQFKTKSNLDLVSSLFAQDRFQQKMAQSFGADGVLDLGLESWRWVDAHQEDSVWKSPWGEVAQSHPSRLDLHLQPTQALILNNRRRVLPSETNQGYEPGPICFGRGQKVLLFDLFYKEAELSELKEWIPQGIESRLQSFLTSLGRAASNPNTTDFLSQLRSDLIERISLELWLKTGAQKILICGVFAPWLLEGLRQQRPDCEWILSRNLDSPRWLLDGVST